MRAKKSGFDVILANADENLEAERDAVEVFLAKRVDGLIGLDVPQRVCPSAGCCKMKRPGAF